MKTLLKYILDRLSERTTWVGIAGLIALYFGATNPDLENAIVQVGMAVVSLLAIVFKDKLIASFAFGKKAHIHE